MNIQSIAKEIQESTIGEERKFEFSAFDQIPNEDELIGFCADSRQRYLSNGIIDNLIIEITPETSAKLGLFILLAQAQRTSETYTLNILDQDSDVRQIEIYIEERCPVNFELTSFSWVPQLVDEFTADPQLYFGHKPHLVLTNESNEWQSAEALTGRDILMGFGSTGGALVVAEFFLNFSLSSSNVNYDYMKYEYAPSILDETSCEVRVQRAETSNSGWISRKQMDA